MLNPSFKLLLAGGVCSLCDGQNLGKREPKNLCSLSFHPQPLPHHCSSRRTHQPSMELPLILASSEKEKRYFKKMQVHKD